MAITIDNNYQIHDNISGGYTPHSPQSSYHTQSGNASLGAGTTVTGQIVEKDGDQVTIRLSNDQTISAKMQGNADIEVGSTMTFEVAKGENGQTALRPLFANLTANSAGISALKAAGLPVNDTTLAMTDRMMSENLPISRNALMGMFRNVSAHPEAAPETIVSMTKLGMPLTETNVIQYENYRSFEHQITNDLDSVTTGVAELFHEAAAEGDTSVMSRVLDLIDTGSLETITFENTGPAGSAETLVHIEPAASEEAGRLPENTGAKEVPVTDTEGNTPGIAENTANVIKNTVEGIFGGIKDMISGMPDADAQIPPEQVNASLSLTPSEQIGLSSDLQSILILAGESADIHEPLDPAQIMTAVKELIDEYPPDETIKVTGSELLAFSEEGTEGSEDEKLAGAARTDIDALRNTAQPNDAAGKNEGNISLLPDPARAQEEAVSVRQQISHKLSELLKSSGFTKLVKDSLTSQMSIRPQDVAQSGKIEELYDRIQRTTARISGMMESLGRADSPVAGAAASLSDNVSFMNNLNEFVNYVQLPLKMAGEDANGELYVYTKKKDLSNKDGNYSALLHLDMDHLGPMDIYVTMRDHTKVNTTFYLASEKLLDFIEAHIDELTKRLTEKGYDTGVRVTKKEDGRKITPIADEFTKDEPHDGAPVVVSKMRFDVRA